MHEEMHAETDQKWQQKRHCAEDVRTMFNPEKHARNGEENAERKSRWSVEKWPPHTIVDLWVNGTVFVKCHDLQISLQLFF